MKMYILIKEDLSPGFAAVAAAHASLAGYLRFITEFNAVGTTGRFVNNRIDLIADQLYGMKRSLSQSEYEAFQNGVDQGSRK